MQYVLFLRKVHSKPFLKCEVLASLNNVRSLFAVPHFITCMCVCRLLEWGVGLVLGVARRVGGATRDRVNVTRKPFELDSKEDRHHSTSECPREGSRICESVC